MCCFTYAAASATDCWWASQPLQMPRHAVGVGAAGCCCGGGGGSGAGRRHQLQSSGAATVRSTRLKNVQNRNNSLSIAYALG